MFDHLLSREQLQLRDEVRDLVSWVPRQMILDMDQDRITFPKEFLQEAGRRNLLGCRHPREWGGRGMDWATTCMIMEEIGVLGYEFACVFGVGAITAHEWYRERTKNRGSTGSRDFWQDAAEAFAEEEIIYV